MRFVDCLIYQFSISAPFTLFDSLYENISGFFLRKRYFTCLFGCLYENVYENAIQFVKYESVYESVFEIYLLCSLLSGVMKENMK